MRTRKFLIILLTGLLPLAAFAQEKNSLEDIDITGLWKGTLYNDTTKRNYRYEIGISEEKGKLSGFSHTFFLDGDKEFYGVKKVKVKKTDGKIIIEDAGLIANNYPVAPAKGVRQLNILTLEIKDSIMQITGPFTTNRTKDYSSLTGSVTLQRKNDFWQSALVPHLQELGKAYELSFVKKELDLVKEMVVKKEDKESKELVSSDKEKEEAVEKKEVVKKEVITKAEPEPDAVVDMFAPKKPESEKPVTKTTEPVKKQETPATVKEPVAKKKVAKPTATKEVPKKANETTTPEKPVENKIKVTAAAAEISSRVTVLQQTVFFSSDSLQISLYDNGEVDGDIVSVVMNGKLIIEKERLSTKAVKKTIYAGPGTDNIELVMYAENLGSIAPNTGLLVVHDGKSIYEVRFSGDLQKNASIILKRK